MGISSDGILVFGVDFGSEQEEDVPKWLIDFMGTHDDGDGFDDAVAKEAGIPAYDHGATEDEKTEHWRRYREAVAACPVEQVLHCSYDYAMVILAVRGTVKRASRGYPQTIEASELEVSALDITRFRDWIREHGGDDVTPTWILTSVYG